MSNIEPGGDETLTNDMLGTNDQREIPANENRGAPNEDEWVTEGSIGSDEEQEDSFSECNDDFSQAAGEGGESAATTASNRKNLSKKKGEAQVDPRFGCKHYLRHCRIIAPCCGDVFPCRHCHNDVRNVLQDNAPLTTKGLHEMDRFAVSEIVCVECSTRQSVSNKCTNCGIRFAEYYCKECKFWDDKGIEKELFHCYDCGICRVGGRGNFFHCATCGSCYPVSLEGNHTCVESAMQNDCPVCMENMFNSIRTVTVLRCGHTIHAHCFRRLQISNLGSLAARRCPLCQKSVEGPKDYWKSTREAIHNTPLQRELMRRVAILCNDCTTRSVTDYHFYGCECRHCGSCNTGELGPVEAAPLLENDARTGSTLGRPRSEPIPAADPEPDAPGRQLRADSFVTVSSVDDPQTQDVSVLAVPNANSNARSEGSENDAVESPANMQMSEAE